MKKETNIAQIIDMALLMGKSATSFTVRYLHSKLPRLKRSTISNYMTAFYVSYPNHVCRVLRRGRHPQGGTYKYYEYSLNGIIYSLNKEDIIKSVGNLLYKKTKKNRKQVTKTDYPIYWHVANAMLKFIFIGESFTSTDVLQEIQASLPTITKLRHITSYVTDIYRLNTAVIKRTRPGLSYRYVGNKAYYTKLVNQHGTANVPFLMYNKRPVHSPTITDPKKVDATVPLSYEENQAAEMVKIQAGTIAELRKAIEEYKITNADLVSALENAPTWKKVDELNDFAHKMKTDKAHLTTSNLELMNKITKLTGTESKREIRVELLPTSVNGFIGAYANATLCNGNLTINLTVNNTKHQWQISKQDLATETLEMPKPPKNPVTLVNGFTVEQYRKAGWTDARMKNTGNDVFKPFIDAGLIK